MRLMKKEDVLHLGTLSRIKLSDAEVEKLTNEISSILDYVSTLDEVVSDGALEKKPGAVFNVFREDEITNKPGEFTEALLREMPATEGSLLKVKKILNPED